MTARPMGAAREPPETRKVVAILDRFLDALIGQAGEGVTVLVTSDHGNIEDSTTRLHTLNPVPLLAVGPAARRFRGVRDITGVTPAILAALGPGAGT